MVKWQKLVIKLELNLILVFLSVFFDLEAEAHARAVSIPSVLSVFDVFVKLRLVVERAESEVA